MSTSSGKYPSFNVTTGPIMPTGLDMQTLALDAASHLSDAPTDGQLYGRESGAWIVVPTGGGGGIAEAPSDGTLYGRKSAAWVHLTHNDITDWAAQLANYYPTSNPSGYQTAAQVAASLGPYALTSAVPAASSTTPIMNGTAAVGTGTTWARADHVHPVDTSRYAASNPSGYQTAAQVTAALPPASTTLPLADSVAAIGTSGAFAPADHVHPLPSQTMGDNRIINGDMRIDQRNSGATGTASGYTIDRWVVGGSSTGHGTWGRNIGSLTTAPGFPYYLGFSANAAYVPVAADTLIMEQAIEADMVSDFQWGTANAQPVTLSFWALCPVTGTFGGAIRNYAGTRSYPFSFLLPTANTWTNIAVTIPGDTAGTWVMSGNGGSVWLAFDLGCGSSARGAAGVWNAFGLMGVTGAVSITGSNTYLMITGVKLETGSVATPFNRYSLAKSMADCQRYYQTGWLLLNTYQSSVAAYQCSAPLIVSMRASPTITPVNNANTNISSFTISTNVGAVYSGGSNTAIGSTAVNCTFTASAEL